MRYQPPDNNDPANPLMKVAALTLDREYVDSKNPVTLRVIANLNFKRSNDMRGRAKTSDGLDVTVSFSLALRRASLEISFSSESIPNGVSPVEIGKVAYIAPLHVRGRESSAKSDTRARQLELGGSAGGQIALSASELDAGAKGTIKGTAKAARKSSQKRRTAVERQTTNISATYSNDTIHWEITPVPEGLDDAGPILSGEVFRGRNSNQIDACVARVSSELSSPLVITGSVFVLAQDLDVNDIKFVDEYGTEIPWRKIDAERNSRLQFGSEAKIRLLKQIIRKHLKEQGMMVDGARIEICRAHA